MAFGSKATLIKVIPNKEEETVSRTGIKLNPKRLAAQVVDQLTTVPKVMNSNPAASLTVSQSSFI